MGSTPRAQPKIQLMGLSIDALTERETLEHVRSECRLGRGGWVVTPNVDQLRQFVGDPTVRSLFAEADLVVADGMPLIWASRLQGTPLPERVPGSDLIWSLTGVAAKEGFGVFLLGGAPGAAEQAKQRLSEVHPGIRVVGTLSPKMGFESDEDELRQIVEALLVAEPHIVFVGLGFPKQERLIRELRPRFPGAWFLGVGISLSFVAGDVDRAPEWMHGLGIEWLFRLSREPRRLFRRYVIDGIPFGLLLLRHALLERVKTRQRR